MDDAAHEKMSVHLYGDTSGGLQRRVGTALAGAADAGGARLAVLEAEVQNLAGVLDLVRGRLTDLERRLEDLPPGDGG